MDEKITEALIEILSENWTLFQKHSPKGAYLPVGQLDGDCGECGVSWPCGVIKKAVNDSMTERLNLERKV